MFMTFFSAYLFGGAFMSAMGFGYQLFGFSVLSDRFLFIGATWSLFLLFGVLLSLVLSVALKKYGSFRLV